MSTPGAQLMAKAKKPLEAVTGRYAAIPHSLLDSVAFMGASHPARSLLYELMRQLDGKNNGQLHLSANWLKDRGWRSKGGMQKAKIEALARGLIIKTREGGLNAGPDRYALTWLPITNFVGLDIGPSVYQPGAYQMMGPFAKPKGQADERQPVVRNAPRHTPPRKCHPVHRGSTGPYTGAVEALTTPYAGAREGDFVSSLPRTPETMNGYHCTTSFPVASVGKKRIVGVAGKSGKPKTAPAVLAEPI